MESNALHGLLKVQESRMKLDQRSFKKRSLKSLKSSKEIPYGGNRFCSPVSVSVFTLMKTKHTMTWSRHLLSSKSLPRSLQASNITFDDPFAFKSLAFIAS